MEWLNQAVVSCPPGGEKEGFTATNISEGSRKVWQLDKERGGKGQGAGLGPGLGEKWWVP